MWQKIRDLRTVVGPKVKAFCCALIETKGDGGLKHLLFTLIPMNREHPPHNEECLDSWGTSRIGKALHSKFGLLKLNPLQQLKIQGLSHLVLFWKQTKPWRWLSEFSTDCSSWLVRISSQCGCQGKRDWVGKHVDMPWHLTCLLSCSVLCDES